MGFSIAFSQNEYSTRERDMQEILQWALLVESPRALRYMSVSLFVGVINLGLFYVLNERCHIGYKKVLFIILPTFLLKFFLQKFWAFEGVDIARVHVELLLTSARQAGFFAMNFGAMWYLVERLNTRPIFAQCALVPPLGTLNYFAVKWILPP